MDEKELKEVEEYIHSLAWGPNATDRDKTLVAGNIRAFNEWLNKKSEKIGFFNLALE